MPIDEDVVPGQSGHASHHNQLAVKANELDELTATGRLSVEGLNTTFGAGAVATYQGALPAGLGWDSVHYPVTPSIQESYQGDVAGSIGETPQQFFDRFSTARSAPGGTFYVSTAGSDSNDGLTLGTAFRSIGKAINAGNIAGVPTRVYVAGGEYPRANGFDATAGYYPQVDMAFIAISGSTRPIVGVWDAASGFTADATHTNTYSKAVANTTRVVDRLTRNRFGNYVELTPAASAAKCNTTPGTWFNDGTKLYVNRGDGAAPSDTNTRYYRDAINLRIQSQVSVYVEGFDLEGCGSNYNMVHVNSSATTPPGGTPDAIVLNNSSLKYGGGAASAAGGGFRAVNWYGIMAAFGCQVDATASDAFGIHNLQNDPAYMLTVNCQGNDLGRGVQSVNFLTLHEECVGIDIAGKGEQSRGGAVHHIQDSKAYLLGTRIVNDLGDAAAGGGIPPVAIRAAENAEVWADRVRVEMPNGTFAYQAVAVTSKIHRKSCAPVRQPDAGSGVIDTY